MTLRLADPLTYNTTLDDWPLPPTSKFMESQELQRLRQDIDRHVRGRAGGRSYLIAGHRGVGKTSLTTMAVELLASTILLESVRETTAFFGDGPLHRPLLVKLEGPSMLEEQRIPTAKPTPGPKPADRKPGAKDDGKDDEESDEGETPPADGTVAAGAHAALVQITIGLYRALAAEAAKGFRAHALSTADVPLGDRPERAAQLALDLDGGVDAGRLRGYWTGIGRLTGGVFWPPLADANSTKKAVPDQGVREITALATAAQAFQVCTGRISYATKVKDSLLRSRIRELKGSSDIRQALRQLGTLGIGALTGVSILAATGTGPSALVGGLAVWLLGSLTISWSDKRTRTDTRSVDYSFIRDSSLATLGRDLPVVIQRVREAGLVPVFVIDELDKIPDAPRALADLIAQLKHLIADYGFFCFLVNRDCFETIEDKVRNYSYPSEHTLFGERLLLRPNPAFMLAYLLDLIAFDGEDPQTGHARAAFALNAMHEARLNLTDLRRFLSRFQRNEKMEIGTIAELTAQRRLIVASVQLAIDETLRDPLLTERMDDDPLFAQLAMDCVYYPSRLWQKDILVIDPSADALRAHLQLRMQQASAEPPQDPAHPPAPASFPLSDHDLGRLQGALVSMLRLLTNTEQLRKKLGDRNASGIDGVPILGDYRLASIPPANVSAICEELSDGRFRFLFTGTGEPAEGDPWVMTREEKVRAKQLLAYVDELQLMVRESSTTLDELALTPFLESVAASTIGDAQAEVRAGLRLGEANAEIRQHIETLERLVAEVKRNGAALGSLLLLSASLRRDAPNAVSIVPKILRLVRFQKPPAQWVSGLQDRPVYKLPGDQPNLKTWRQDFRKWLLPSPGTVPWTPITPYTTLIDPFRSYFANGKKGGELLVDYPTLLEAVRGNLPATALRADLSRMSADDWSALALAAVPRRRVKATPAPYWMLILALRGLGFGQDALLKLADRELGQSLHESGFMVETEGMTAEVCFALALEFARDAPKRRGGILVIDGPENKFGAHIPNQKLPALVVDILDFKDYLPFLEWLIALDVIVGRTVGLDRETEIA